MRAQREENPIKFLKKILKYFESFDSFRFTYRCARFNMQHLVNLRSFIRIRFKLMKTWDRKLTNFNKEMYIPTPYFTKFGVRY